MCLLKREVKDVKKKLVIIGLILCLVFTVVGCGTKADKQPADKGAAEEVVFPTNPITLVVPVVAGSGADTHTRKLAVIAEKYLGQPIIVENIEGGATAIGTINMLSRPADGYTIAQGSPSIVMLMLSDNPPFKLADIQPIIVYNGEPNALTVRTDGPFKTMEDFIQYAKDNPRKIKISSSGSGSVQHLTLNLLAREAGFEYIYVPFDGGRDAVLALMGGNVDATGPTPANSKSQIDSGEFTVLAVSGDTRMSTLPDVRTYMEMGYNVPIVNWRSLITSADVPKEHLKILEDAFTKAVHDPEFVEWNEQNGQLDYYKNTEDFGKLLAEYLELFEAAKQ